MNHILINDLNKNSKILNIKTIYFVCFSFFLFFIVVLVNDGFMALDEYWVGITRYIPAQSSSIMNLVRPDDVKSPLQMLPMFIVAQAAYLFGIVSPYYQYRFVIFVLGLLNWGLLAFGFLSFGKEFRLKTNEKNFLFLIFTFYFGSAFALTRPMYESIAAPWLLLATVWALKYHRDQKLSDLLFGVFFISVTFVLRQQLGFCALVFLYLTVIHKKWKHLAITALFGGLLFVLSGIPDYFLRGQFHFSLLNLTVYNYQHGADYGKKPITFYPLMIFVMTLAPFFIRKYSKETVQLFWRDLRPVWVVVALFIFLHSLFPQKWERFLISLIPLFILLLFPLLLELQNKFKNHKLRVSGLYGVNFFVFFIASFFPPQKNLIEMSRYLNQHPEIKKIYRLNETPGWITEAFIIQKQFEFQESNQQELLSKNWQDCSEAVVIAQHDLVGLENLTSKLQKVAEFNVNMIENLAYKLNQKNNLRRVKLHLYIGNQCQIK